MIHGRGVVSSSVMRVLLCAGIALGAAWAGAPAMAQDELDRCTIPLMPQAEAPDPQAFWNDDRQVSVWRRQDGQRSAYHVVGDVVELTPKLFPALATSPGAALKDVSEISIDAREIIVAMPIRIADGAIRLVADAVRFTGDGSISLVDRPGQRDQMVEVVTNQLDLSHAPDMPFVFQTQGWVINATPQWPAAGAPKRLLRIKARAVVPAADITDISKKQLSNDPLRWFHNKTADQGFDSGLPKSLWSSGYDITIGDAGGGIYDGLLGATLLWPDLAVGKLARLWSRAPFDPTVNVFVNAKIDELMPLLSRRASQQSAATLRLARAQMALGVDLVGYGIDEVPMTGLSERLKAFQKQLDEVFGTPKKAGALQLWDEARLAALATGKLADPAKLVDQLDRMLKAEVAARTATALRITGNSDRLQKMIDDGHAKIAEAAGIDESLLTQYNDEKAQAASFGRIVDDLIINETTIGIGRPAAAPYSLGWTPGTTTAQSFYGTKDGDTPSNPPSGLEEIAGRYDGYAKLIADFNAAWKAADSHAAAALGHLTGKQPNDAELAAYGKAIPDVVAKAEALRAGVPDGPAQFTIGLNDYTPVDPDQQKKWTGLVMEAEAAMAGASNLQAVILADVRSVRAVDADIQWLSAIRNDLLALKSLPGDDAVQRQALLSATMRARLLTDVGRSAMVLRKGFYFVTGELMGAPDEALYPWDDVLAAGGIDARHPELNEPAQMQLAMQADRAALNQYYEGFAGGLAERAGAFVDKRPAVPPSVEFFRAAYEDDVSHDLDESYLRTGFLDALNRSIASQIALGRAGTGFASNPILIPIRISPAGPSAGAQFLLGAAVTKVHFDGDPKMQGSINLRIEHPRWGNVTIDGTCRRVIDAADNPAGIETGFSKTISLLRDVQADWKKSVATDQALASIIDNAFPLDAPYYAYVELPQATSWTRIPVIDEIEIVLVKTGTRLQ